MEKSLIILRGIPGSGKSLFAEQFQTSALCCADDYHMRNGVYKWNVNFISEAHAWCQRKCRRFMENGISKIIIANTNTTEKEMLPYYDLANKHEYKVFSVIVENRHGGVNVHNVPEQTIEKMKNRFEIKLL